MTQLHYYNAIGMSIDKISHGLVFSLNKKTSSGDNNEKRQNLKCQQLLINLKQNGKKHTGASTIFTVDFCTTVPAPLVVLLF